MVAHAIVFYWLNDEARACELQAAVKILPRLRKRFLVGVLQEAMRNVMTQQIRKEQPRGLLGRLTNPIDF